MRTHTRNVPLKVLNVLINADDYVSTKELIERTGAERKSIYNAIANLNDNGFLISTIQMNRQGYRLNEQSLYKFDGVYQP